MRGLMVCALALMAGGAEAAAYRYVYTGTEVIPGDPASALNVELRVDFGDLPVPTGDFTLDVIGSTSIPPFVNTFGLYNDVDTVTAPFTTANLITNGISYASGLVEVLGFFYFDADYNLLPISSVETIFPDTGIRLMIGRGYIGGVPQGFALYEGDEGEVVIPAPYEWTRTEIVVSPPEVPLPASAPLGILALAGLFALRRRA